MNHYKITYTINARNERVYPAAMKGAVFTMTQDHPSEHLMVAATESDLAEDGTAVVSLAADEAQTLMQQFQDSMPKPPPMPGDPFPVPPGAAQ